ncbi:MAG: hypothetical protein IKV87_03250 [Methanobrevibacter sp.]|nr:hypothetical protein [Methanobrevibacter sp.]
MNSRIESVYRKLECDRIHQGDILKNFSFFQLLGEIHEGEYEKVDYNYSIVLSQDCDLDGASKLDQKLLSKGEEELINGNKFFPSVLIAPLFEEKELNEGTYLSHLKFKMDEKGKKHKTKWKDIVSNNNPRYHYLGNFDETSKKYIMDFKIFYSVPYKLISNRFEDCYFTSLNELFREDLSNRFFNYHSRIGLPEFDKNNK